jgi:hypothetical protein
MLFNISSSGEVTVGAFPVSQGRPLQAELSRRVHINDRLLAVNGKSHRFSPWHRDHNLAAK